MKNLNRSNIIVRSVFLLCLILVLFSCEGKRGPMGPEGPQGEQGSQGKPGEDLEISTYTGTLKSGDLLEDYYWEFIFPFSLEDCLISVFVRGEATEYEWLEPLWTFDDRKIYISKIHYLDLINILAGNPEMEFLIEPGYQYKIIIAF